MSENKKKKKDKVVAALNFGNGLVSFGAALLAIVLILYSGYVLYDSMAIEVSAFSSNSDLLKYKPSVSVLAQPEGPSLSEVNPSWPRRRTTGLRWPRLMKTTGDGSRWMVNPLPRSTIRWCRERTTCITLPTMFTAGCP